MPAKLLLRYRLVSSISISNKIAAALPDKERYQESGTFPTPMPLAQCAVDDPHGRYYGQRYSG